MTGSPGCGLVEPGRGIRRPGKVNGSATSSRALGSKPDALGPAVEVPRIVGQPGGLQVAPGARGPTRPAHRLMAGVSSISWPVPTTDSAAHPTHGQRMEHRLHRADDVLQRPGVGTGGGHHHQVRTLADRLEHGAGHLAGGLGGHRVLGQRAGEGHDGSVAGRGEPDVERAEIGVQSGVLDGDQVGRRPDSL